MSTQATSLPNELIHNILGYIDESDGPYALNACMPVSPQFLEIARSYVWRELQIEPVNVEQIAERIKPEIARHVRELYIESDRRLRKSWLRDPNGLGFCLHHNFSKLQKLSLAFVTWTSLSLANQMRLHELTQVPAFQDLRAIGVKDMPPSLIVGLRGLKHLVASSVTMSARPVSLPPFTGRRSHLESLSVAFVPSERQDTPWEGQVQGIVNLLSLLFSPVSPVSLTRLRAISVNIQLVTILRPGLYRALEACAATLECLKIRAGENHTFRGGLMETNEPLYLARHTALKSIFIHIECLEEDPLDWLIKTLATLGPTTPLREITICVNHEPMTRPFRKSDRWARLDHAFARLQSYSLRRVKFVLLVHPSFCACVPPQHCRQCTRERKFGQEITASLPRSVGVVFVIKVPSRYDAILELFSVNESAIDPWQGAVPLTYKSSNGYMAA